MKTNLRFLLATALLAASTLWLGTSTGRAQDVAIGPAEFQRMVYSGHLLTVLAAKPELDASLQVLLELQRRNPNATPAALADVSRQALDRYRTNAPAYIRINGFRDEILAAYLEAFRQVPARGNFVQANLTLLKQFMLDPDDYTNSSPADLMFQVNSANQRMLAVSAEATQRQAVVDACIARAKGNATFTAAVDGLLVPQETLISIASSPAAIIGNTNSALYGNYTMQTLLALSLASGNGSLTISSNALMTLYASERQTLWNIINTNRTLEVEFNQNHPDLLAYLGDANAINAQIQHELAVKQGQPRTIASASAAILVQSKLLDAPNPRIWNMPKEVRAVGGILANYASAFSQKDPGALINASFGVFDLMNGTESPEETNVRELGNIKSLIQDLSANQNYRFDRVDQSLVTIFNTLNNQFNLIQIIGNDVAVLNGNVNDIRHTLVGMQIDLHRLERHLFDYFNGAKRNDLALRMDGGLFFETQNPSTALSYYLYALDPDAYETTFFSYATTSAKSAESSPGYNSGDLTDAGLNQRFDDYDLEANLDYIKAFLFSNLGMPTAGSPPLHNPRDWFFGAYAYLQLASENPMLFRQKGVRVPTLSTPGQNLASFFRSLTFTNSSSNSFNWPLHTALTNYYRNKSASFANEIQTLEQQYAVSNGFALDTWRQWSAAAPRVTATNTQVAATAPLSPVWMDPGSIPIAIASGHAHNLALRADRKVVAWGDNSSYQLYIPLWLTNVVAVAAGWGHSLALLEDRTVFGTGLDSSGQATGLPGGGYGFVVVQGQQLSNVVAIAAGAYHSLALKADSTVAAWGNNGYGQINVPAGLTNVVAIAAGWGHSLALKTDGTIVGWGYNAHGEATGVPNNVAPHISSGLVTVLGQTLTNLNGSIAAGDYHSLALKSNGTVVGWGYNALNQIAIPAGLTNVVKIAAGQWHSLALKSNGTVVGWGYNGSGQTISSAGLTSVKLIAAGGDHNLALRANGTVFGWGDNGNVLGWGGNGQGQINTLILPPAVAISAGSFDLGDHILVLANGYQVNAWGHFDKWYPTYEPWTNIVDVAAGYFHSLLLKGNGTVVGGGAGYPGSEGLGHPHYGQTITPPGLTNVVAVAAGGWHSLALKADSKVVGWGLNSYTQTNIPPSATNVIAIVAGDFHSLALRADSTVVGFGLNDRGQATGVASPTPFSGSGVVTLGGQVLTNVTAIAAGYQHSVALRANGTVIAWGNNSSGQTNVPAGLTNVVSIAARSFQSLALKENGTVVGWGLNSEGRATGVAGGPAGLVTLGGKTLTNVVAIATAGQMSLALRADGTIVGWGDNQYNEVPAGLANAVAIAANRYHGLALRADGTVAGWGNEEYGQVPASLTNAVAVAAGKSHSLALRADGTVLGWGSNDSGQTNTPPGLSNVKTVTAGGGHNLALLGNGTVIAWGNSGNGQTNVPFGATDVVAIAAGDFHSLAIKGNGTVVGWGANVDGRATGVANGPAGLVTLGGMTLTNVVAIAAGPSHSLALKADGTVVGWGYNPDGRATGVNGGPAGMVAILGETLTNVVAIAAGTSHGLAIKADGTAVGWGKNTYGQNYISYLTTNVVAIAAGADQNLFLTANTQSAGDASPSLQFVRARIPRRAGELLRGTADFVSSELALGSDAGTELSGAKKLLGAVLELGMPYTLERDDVLRGFLYGSESLMDLETAKTLLLVESAKLADPEAKPETIAEAANLRYQRFAQRLSERLVDLRATGQPEIPRLVGHTLRLLDILQDSYNTVPPSSLEIGSKTNGVGLVLYGEPYARYTLLQSSNLNNWTSSSITNLRSADSPIGIIDPPLPNPAEPQRYYRAVQPVP